MTKEKVLFKLITIKEENLNLLTIYLMLSFLYPNKRVENLKVRWINILKMDLLEKMKPI